MSERTLDPEILDYIQQHRSGVLATTNRSGSPQQTLIGYRFNGNDIAISTRAESLKVKNISKRPQVSLAVVDGRNQVIVYGRAKIVRDPSDVLEVHRQRLLFGDQQEAELAERLRREVRVVLIVTPEKFYPDRLRQR